VTINQRGEERAILTISERPKGDLNLITRLYSIYDHPTKKLPKPNPSMKVKENRFTIHPSKKSIMGVHTINHNYEFMDGSKGPIKTFTRALKKYNNFIPVFFRRCSDLIDESSEITDGTGYSINLGSYDPDYFTLMFQVFVGPKDRDFEPPMRDESANVKIHKFKEFTVVIMWSFLNIPAGTVGYFFFLGGKRNESDLQNNEISEYHADEQECEKRFMEFKSISIVTKLAYYEQCKVPKNILDLIFRSAIFSNVGENVNHYSRITSNQVSLLEVNTILGVFQNLRRL
jgi:hypothetical protein